MTLNKEQLKPEQLRQSKTRREKPPLERLAFSINEAATALSICRRSVEHLIKVGRLKAKKLNRRVLIPAAELKKLISI
jgi:excisionase family DNA binding protein